MKNLLIIPSLFACYIGIGQAKDSASIIGKPLIIGNLVVTQHDFPNTMNWDDAKRACTQLETGWRLPTVTELDLMFMSMLVINRSKNSYYWSSIENSNLAWAKTFYNGEKHMWEKKRMIRVRAVKSL
jgi:hypothetical protein